MLGLPLLPEAPENGTSRRFHSIFSESNTTRTGSGVRRKHASAWKAKTEAAKVRHELDLTQEDFATMLGVSLATIRKWERGTGEPSGAAKTLLAGRCCNNRLYFPKDST